MFPLLLALALTSTADAGRAKAGFSSKKVTKFQIAIDVGPGLDGAIVPALGSPVSLTLTDKRGRTLSTTDGSLRSDSRKIEIEVDGGRYDPATGTLIAKSPKGEAARNAKVTVIANYHKRPDLEVIRVLQVDWRAVLGPDPKEVRDLTLRASSPEIVDEWLLPGATVNVAIDAHDVHGRTYSTQPDGPLHLPWTRLDQSADFMSGPGGALVASKELKRTDKYAARFEYIDADKAVSATWRPDFQRLLGPEPDEVKTLRWSLVQPPGSPDGKAPLGALVPVDVDVTTTEGRVFKLRTGGKMRLVPDRLVVSTERATWKPENRGLLVDEEIPGGKPFSMKLHYQGRPDLGGTLGMKPDYIGSIPDSWWSPDGGYAFGGENGDYGRGGEQGQRGVDGRDAPGPQTRAERGTNGRDGVSGESGQAGSAGPRVRVSAAVAWTLDRSDKVVVYSVSTDGRHPELRVKKWDAPPVQIGSVGGHGGVGGNGGSGGDGGRGGGGCLTGDGGDAGSGADGGDGGNGGQGGTVALVATSPELEAHFTLYAAGGRGGQAGNGGSAGVRGNAPSYSTPSTEYDDAGVALPSPTCESGRNGVEGRAGRSGRTGQDGARGETKTRVSPEATTQIGSLPAELRRAISF